MSEKDTLVYIQHPEFVWVQARLEKTEGDDKAYVPMLIFANEQLIHPGAAPCTAPKWEKIWSLI